MMAEKSHNRLVIKMKPQTTVQKLSVRSFFRIRSRKPLETLTTSEEELFLYSKPLEDAYPRPIDSFTVIPCRVGLKDDGVRAAAQRLYGEETVIKMLSKRTSGSSIAGLESPMGHFATLVYPECIPERLDMVAYVLEMGNLFDGVFKTVSSQDG